MDHNDESSLDSESQALAVFAAADPSRDASEFEFKSIQRKLSETIKSKNSSTSGKQPPKWAFAAAAVVVALGFGTGAGYSIAAKGPDLNTSSKLTSDCLSATPCNDLPAAPGALNSTKESKLSGIWQGGGYFNGTTWLTPTESLSDTAGQEVGYLFSSEGIDRNDALVALANALGMSDFKTVTYDESTTLTEKDSDASLTLNGPSDSLMSWWFDQPSNSPNYCNQTFEEPQSDAISPRVMSSNSSAPCVEKSGAKLSESEAIASAKEIFKSAGLDLNSVNWSVQSGANYFGSFDGKDVPYVHVVAQLEINGQIIGSNLEWSIDLAPDKSIAHAYGFLSKPVPTAAYETVGAKTATLRSQDLKWTSNYSPQLIDTADASPVSTDLNPIGQQNTKPKVDDAGRPVLEVSMDDVRITSASNSLYSQYRSDGSLVLFPAYKLCGEGRCWNQISVADKYLEVISRS